MAPKNAAPQVGGAPSVLPASITLPAPSSALLAHLSPSPSPTLRVYSTASASSSLVLDVALGEGLGMASAAVWCDVDDTLAAGEGRPKKKKGNATESSNSQPLLAVGFASGIVQLYTGSAMGAGWKLAGTLGEGSIGGSISAMTHSSAQGLALALLPTAANPRPSLVVFSSPVSLQSQAETFPIPAALPPTAISALAFPPVALNPPAILVGSHSIHLVSLASTSQTSVAATFPGGHSTAITQIVPVPWETEDETAIVTIATDDRSASVWNLPAFPHEPRLKSTIPLPSPILALTTSAASQHVAFLTSNQVHTLPLVHTPTVAAAASTPSKPGKKNRPSVLAPKTSLYVTEAPDAREASLLAVAFLDSGKVGWARSLGGRGVVWEKEEYVDGGAEDAASGAWRGVVILERRGVGEVLRTESGVAGTGPKPTTRYRENASTAVATAASLPAVPSMATPTLGSLLSTPNLAPLPSTGPSTLNPLSLSRLLTQALHSSDAPLLNQCLSHSDATLIRETVRRLQPELSVVLLERLAERLALGGKGRAGGASAQRMRGVGAWTRGVLRERIAYLVSVPDLLPRLAPLHHLLSTRLQLTTPLLSLSGRLDLALAQIESQQQEKERSLAADPGAVNGSTGGVYVEGESEDEGDIEDVGLGGEDSSDEGEFDEDEDADMDDEDDSDLDGSSDGENAASAFIDDEASEEGSEAGDESSGGEEDE